MRKQILCSILALFLSVSAVISCTPADDTKPQATDTAVTEGTGTTTAAVTAAAEHPETAVTEPAADTLQNVKNLLFRLPGVFLYGYENDLSASYALGQLIEMGDAAIPALLSVAEETRRYNSPGYDHKTFVNALLAIGIIDPSAYADLPISEYLIPSADGSYVYFEQEDLLFDCARRRILCCRCLPFGDTLSGELGIAVNQNVTETEFLSWDSDAVLRLGFTVASGVSDIGTVMGEYIYDFSVENALSLTYTTEFEPQSGPLPYDDVSETVFKQFDILMNTPDAYSAEGYITAHPKAYDAIVALGDAALPYLQQIVAETPLRTPHRIRMAQTLAHAIDPDLYDTVSTSPDGTVQLSIDAADFFYVSDETGIFYKDITLTDAVSGEVLAKSETESICHPEITWSPDSRYAVIHHGHLKYGGGTPIVIDTDAKTVSPVSGILDAVAAELGLASIELYSIFTDTMLWETDAVRISFGIKTHAASNPGLIGGHCAVDGTTGKIVETMIEYYETPKRTSPAPDNLSLSDAPHTESVPTACDVIPLPDDTVTKVEQQTEYAGMTAAVVCTSDQQWHFALCGDDGYTSVARLSDDRQFEASRVTLTPFDNVLGHSGVTVSVPAGANAMHRMYFALDGGEPLLLTVTAKGTDAQDGMLIEQYTMGGILYLYRMENGAVVCYDLNALFQNAYAYADQIQVTYHGNAFYEAHNGLFTVQVQNPGENGYGDNYTGWLDGDRITLMHWDDMVLPEPVDTGDSFRTDDAARAWINAAMYTDFVLREPLAPTALDREALQSYMDDAYTAGIGVLALYEIDAERLFGGSVLSGNAPAYFCAGQWYYDMKNPAFPTFAAWEDYMRQILSDTMVDSLTARHDRFISVNGGLWGCGGVRGTSINTREVGAGVSTVSETEIIYTVSVEIRDPEAVDWAEADLITHDFIYSKTEDGWRWTVLYLYN